MSRAGSPLPGSRRTRARRPADRPRLPHGTPRLEGCPGYSSSVPGNLFLETFTNMEENAPADARAGTGSAHPAPARPGPTPRLPGAPAAVDDRAELDSTGSRPPRDPEDRSLRGGDGGLAPSDRDRDAERYSPSLPVSAKGITVSYGFGPGDRDRPFSATSERVRERRPPASQHPDKTKSGPGAPGQPKEIGTRMDEKREGQDRRPDPRRPLGVPRRDDELRPGYDAALGSTSSGRARRQTPER